MNPELEKFIDFAVTDGEVTEKEKTILIRKAEELGVDLDEMEMVLNAKLHMAKKEAQPKEVQAEVPPPAENKPSLVKCPQCAAAIESFSTKCPYCDAEIRNVKASNAITEFHRAIMKAEEDTGNTIKISWKETLLSGIDTETAKMKAITRKKISIISSFPVPNSKEDILEFLTLAKSNVNSIPASLGWKLPNHINHHNYQLKNAWIGKCDQLITKARFSMKDDKKTLEEIEAYATELEIK